jgi:Domain amino terminal to FKBP-type peptidyl-prolyl isomerase
MSPRRWWMALAVAGVVAAVAGAAASAGYVFGAKATPAFKSDVERASYAIGLNLARQLRTMASDLDERALAQGFDDGRAAEGKARLTNQEVTATLAALRKTYQQKLASAHASAGPPITSAPGMSVFFKLDPRLTSQYGGDRWVSPPTYTRVGDAKGAVIEARAQAQAQGRGATPATPPQWAASDPGMVDVTPGKGGAVTITVKRPGTSNIRITSGELTKELALKAETKNNVLQVAISQN